MRTFLTALILAIIVYIVIHLISNIYDVHHMIMSYLYFIGANPQTHYTEQSKGYVSMGLGISFLTIIIYGIFAVARSVGEAEEE